jgi:sulfur dioxygenase
MTEQKLLFRQLFDHESSTYTYVLADIISRDAIIIDPVLEQLERDLKLINELSITLKYTLETHTHADHITAASKIAEATGAKKVTGINSGAECADIKLADGDMLTFGSVELKALATPGHTHGCMTYLVGDKAFTGDALFIRGCGRTDFQEGSAIRLFDSVREKLFSLPDSTKVYPAHDYKGHSSSTIGEEKIYNPRLKLSISKPEFIAIMNSLNLPEPKKIHEAVVANLNCGQIAS